eukprot:15482530-Alexandrium_andersonii.AAC.1
MQTQFRDSMSPPLELDSDSALSSLRSPGRFGHKVARLRAQDKRPELGLLTEEGACAELRLTASGPASRAQGRTSTA